MPRRVKRAPRIPKRRAPEVTRAEFNRAIDLLNDRCATMNDLIHNQDIQFKRIAQLQQQFDELKRAWDRMNLPRVR